MDHAYFATTALLTPRQLPKYKVKFTVQYAPDAPHFYLVPVVMCFIVWKAVAAYLR